MALQRDAKYSGRFDAATTEQPQGAFKNRTSTTSKDGSYLEKDWLNDWSGFFSSLLDAAGVSADGNVDEVGASQYYNAMKSVIDGTTSLAASGYQTLPSGLIIQWGVGSASNSGTSNTLPIAFPTSHFVTIVNHQGTDPSEATGSGVVSATSLTTTTFTAYNSGATTPASIHYISIGY